MNKVAGTWNQMSDAPITGPVREVLLRIVERGYSGNPENVVVAHWAHGDGDGLMPPFGPAWFRRSGSGFVEVQSKDILGWAELPGVTAAPAGGEGGK